MCLKTIDKEEFKLANYPKGKMTFNKAFTYGLIEKIKNRLISSFFNKTYTKKLIINCLFQFLITNYFITTANKNK